jgi:RNA polymerase sigma factor (sigma-70 family)
MKQLQDGSPAAGAAVNVVDLLAHRRWLRRLAHHLVAGAGDAEDAVQETWLAALRAPPRGRQRARAWLGQVLRNALRHGARRDRRRRGREQAAAALLPAAGAPAAGALERLETQRRLIALVAALDEPFRTAVVMRYFEERTAADVARALGVPDATVRWRVREALARLRRALEREFPGAHGAWAVALLPLARAAVPTAAAPGSPLPWLAAGLLASALAVPLVVLIHAGGSSRGGDVHGSSRGRTTRGAGDVAGTFRGGEVGGSARGGEVGGTSPARGSVGVLAAGALALAARPVPPREALARARGLWAGACPVPGEEIVAAGGLCASRREVAAGVCAEVAAVGERLVAVPRRAAERAQAIALWKVVSAAKELPFEVRVEADLALAVDKLEHVLAIEPSPAGLSMDRRDPARFDEEARRFGAWGQELGRRGSEAVWAFERLAGASPELPETRVARAWLGQTHAELGRLTLAREIPAGLRPRNEWGRSEPAQFCAAIARRADGLFHKARRAFRACLDAPGAPAPAATALCARELARLPRPAPE